MSQDFWGSRLSAAQCTTSAVQVEPSGAVATKKHRGRNAGFMITKNLVRSSKHNKTSKNYFCLLLASFSPQFVYMFGRVAQCGASPISPNSCPFSFSALSLPCLGIRATVQVGQMQKQPSEAEATHKNTTESSMGLHHQAKPRQICFLLFLVSCSLQFVYLFCRVAQCAANLKSPNSCPFFLSLSSPFPFSGIRATVRVGQIQKQPRGTEATNKNTTESGMGASWLGKTLANLVHKTSKPPFLLVVGKLQCSACYTFGRIVHCAAKSLEPDDS